MTGKSEMIETEGREVETLPPTGNEKGLNVRIDQMIQLAEKADKVAAAMDKIRRLALHRALPGDWVRFGDKLNMVGPAAERVAADFGISFTNWSSNKEEGTDANGEWYIWYYKADVRLGDRIIESVEGRAGSRDKLFGYANGSWKPLSDVREADIRTAARRCVYKEGTKLMLGLRSIPVEAAESVGLDPSKIKTVEFGQAGETATTAAASGSAVTIKEVKAFTGKTKSGPKKGKDYIRYDIFDTTGAKYSSFDEKVRNAADAAKAKGVKVLIAYEVSKFGNDIKSLKEAPAGKQEKKPDTVEEPQDGGQGW